MTSIRPIYAYGFLTLLLVIIPAIWLFGGLPAPTPCNSLFFLFPLIWGVALLLALLALLRRVEARDNALVIFTNQGEEAVAYRDIAWVFEMHGNRGPAWACAKFLDRRHQKTRFVLYIPRSFSGWEESALTQSIRRRAQRANPAYSPEAEPSKWKVTGILFLSMLPMVFIQLLICPEFFSGR
jgi:hypothetical protein